MIGILAIQCGLFACAEPGTDEPGSIRVRISGEQGAKVGYPFESDGETIGFVDGWSLRFDEVVVGVAALRLSGADGDEAPVIADAVVASLRTEDPVAWEFEGVPARRWDRLSYALRAPADGTRNLGGVPEATLTRMRALGAALYVTGTATSAAGRVITFELHLPASVVADRCESGRDARPGVVVAPSARTDVELTVHLDHLFFDSLVVDTAEMRFEALAAVADAGGRITLDALAAQPLADLRDATGAPLRDESGALLFYDPGSAPLAAPTLREFVRASLWTVGHLDGEGHCEYARE
jgi:hypothetical protein